MSNSFRDRFDGLDGASVSVVKAQIAYKHNPHVMHVMSFRDHNDLNRWLSSSHVKGKVRVHQLLIRYDYEDSSI